MNKLQTDYKNLLVKDNECEHWFSDITFIVNKETFKAHKIVLALRDRVWDCLNDLQNQLIQNKYSKKKNAYILNNIDANEFRNLLLYLYSSENVTSFSTTVKKFNLTSKNPLFTLAEDFERALVEEDSFSKYSDIIIKVEDKEYYLHKCILCSRSDYFAAMFRSNLAEASQDKIELHEIEAGAFHRTIVALYSGTVDVPPEKLIEFIEVVQQLRLVDILHQLQQMVHQYITVDNVIEFCNMADEHSLDLLKAYCIYYLLIEYNYISTTDKWHTLSEDLRAQVEEKRSKGARWNAVNYLGLDNAIKNMGKDDLVQSFSYKFFPEQ